MMVLRPIRMVCLAVVAALSYLEEPAQAAAIHLTQIDFEYDSSPWTLGWKFTVNEPVFVGSLGVYDSGQDGLAGTAQVGLWLASGGAPIVQTTVPAGTVADLDGYFRFALITPTLLTPGTEYIVGSYLSGELATALFGGNGIVDPRVNVIDVRYSNTPAFSFPSLTDRGTDGAAFLGPNYLLTPVPLPASAWLFSSGVVWLLLEARKRFGGSP